MRDGTDNKRTDEVFVTMFTTNIDGIADNYLGDIPRAGYKEQV